MSRLLCCLRARPTMGGALSHPQEGEACDGGPAAPPTMADVIRERKKKAGGAGLGTLRRRLAAAARRPRDSRPDRDCEHARFIRSVVSSWRLVDVFQLCAQLEAGGALRDLVTQAELAREPAQTLHAQLARAHKDRWWCDVELVGPGWSLAAHRAVLAARCSYFRDLLQRYPPAPGCWRVPLEGAAAGLSRDELEAVLLALYAGTGAGTGAGTACTRCRRGEGDAADEAQRCACGAGAGASLRRLGALLGFSPDALHRDMRYLLDSGEMADARLVFRLEGGCGSAYGFRAALELPCHRVVLAARSRFFRSVMSRRGVGVGAGAGASGPGASGAVCVDEAVLPRRFARALLHAAYTDQVDLGLIGRSSTSPSSTTGGASNGSTAWGSRLDDAFQLYEIARFVEMPIAVQGCEDAIAEALSPDTLPAVLRWAAQPHASVWVHRQAMRYLRDEFPAIMAHAAGARVPRAALAEALSSPFLQASEPQALRALLRWAADQPHERTEPNVVWHTAPGRRARRRSGGSAALRDALSALLPLVRLEHLPPDHDALHQLSRRGITPALPADAGSAAAWLGRPPHRPARSFAPHLDEVRALLQAQPAPAPGPQGQPQPRVLQRIPDTLYMVGAGRGGGACAAALCVSPRLLASLRARALELRAAAPALLAMRLHSADTQLVCEQIALRAVREMSLPDACAELLLPELQAGEREREREREREPEPPATDCCRSLGGSLGGSVRRRAAPSAGAPGWSAGRLSAAVPDVAMAPNANTHLLTARDYCRPWDHCLQLDLGDGATHAPRPGSRAQRAAPQSRPQREPAACPRGRPDDELRAAIELSVIRAYSAFGRARGACSPGGAATLPPRERQGPQAARRRASASPPPAPSLGVAGAARASRSPSPLYRHRDYRLEAGYGSSGSGSRSHSPNYA